MEQGHGNQFRHVSTVRDSLFIWKLGDSRPFELQSGPGMDRAESWEDLWGNVRISPRDLQ